MKTQIINTIITFVVTGGLGYCVSTIKNMKQKKQEKEDTNQSKARNDGK